MRCFFVIAVLLATPAFADDARKTTKIEGNFLIPKDIDTFENQTVEIRLYAYNPFIAGKAADLVEKVEMKKFSHAKGKDTKKKFVIGAKGKFNARMKYYVTFFVLDNGKRTHMGVCAHKKGLCNVLAGGLPGKIEVKVRSLKRK